MFDNEKTAYRYGRTEADSARIKFRRALTLMLMTLVMPGSAQLVMGSKRLGRGAIRVWIALWCVLGILVLLAATSRGSIFTLVTSPTVLWLARACAIAIGVSWAALFVDAWRLSAPLELRRKHRLMVASLNSIMCFATAGSLFFGAHIMSVQQDFIGTVFAAHHVSAPEHGRYNVLLLGGDSGPDRFGVRPDSMTLASIDKATGRTVLIALPRNLQHAPFPSGSTMDKQFPDGFSADGGYLNSVNTWVDDHSDLFPGVNHPGIKATELAIEEITGLKINYYAMVNLRGFASLVDAVGGVKIHVPAKVPIGGIGGPITGYVPAGTHKLNGKQTLWFARSRVNNNDYSRMARQKCVMNAMLHQLSPQNVLLNVQKIADSSKKMLSTDIPSGELDTFMELALKARTATVSTVSIVPPAINTSDPDFAKIRRMVNHGVDRAEGKQAGHHASTKTAEPDPKKAVDKDKQHAAQVNEADDLGAVC